MRASASDVVGAQREIGLIALSGGAVQQAIEHGPRIPGGAADLETSSAETRGQLGNPADQLGVVIEDSHLERREFGEQGFDSSLIGSAARAGEPLAAGIRQSQDASGVVFLEQSHVAAHVGIGERDAIIGEKAADRSDGRP